MIFLLLQIFACIIGVVILLYFWVINKFNYWKKKGIPFIEPIIPTGTIFPKGGMQRNIGLINQEYYKKMKGKGAFCGIYFYVQPGILVTDIDFVKKVLVKDFQYFHDRGMFFNEKDDPLSGHLFNLEGDKWRTLRAKLTSTFTSGKMKYMFPILVSIGDEFIATIQNDVQKSQAVEMKEILARFTTDIIGSCAFGIECNSLKYPNAEFRNIGRKIFAEPRHPRYIQILVSVFRDIARRLHYKHTREDVHNFLMNAIISTVEYREKNNVERNDFLNLLIKLKNDNHQITLNELAAQCFVFFIAGFETSSTAMSYVLFELAQNSELQEKARQCVNEVLSKHNNEITYEAINEMSYLDCCINGKK